MAEVRVRVRRAYEESEPGDGARVLVDRIWPRGLTKAKAALDEWCKHVAPSDELRKWYGHDPGRFEEFGRRYRLELQDPTRAEALAHLRRLAKNRQLTLLTATRHTEISEAAVLAALLQGQQSVPGGKARTGVVTRAAHRCMSSAFRVGDARLRDCSPARRSPARARRERPVGCTKIMDPVTLVGERSPVGPYNYVT
jgi:uncharacterized protein YeaO (DUF488 family)